MEMFRYLAGVLEKEDKKTWRKLILFSFVSPVTDIFSFSIIIYIINTIVRENQVSAEMAKFVFFMGFLSVFIGLFELYKTEIRNRLEYNGVHRLSMKICELFIKEDLVYHNQKSAMQTLSMVRSDTQNCIEIVMISIRLGANCLTLAGCFMVLIYVSKWIGIITCVLLIIAMAGMFLQYRTQIKAYGERRRKNLIKVNAQITVAYGIYKELKISDSPRLVLKRYEDASRGYAQVQMKFGYRNSVINMIMQRAVVSFLFLLLAFLMWSRGGAVVQVLASMVVYITILVRMIPLAYFIVNGMNHIEFNKKSYEVLRENLERYNEMKAGEEKNGKVRQKKIVLKKGIRIRNLSFKYNEQMDIFRDASVDIPAGCSVAIIGVSGAGKTTLLDLLLGLLQPQEGSILYDDYDIISQTDSRGKCQTNLGKVVSYIPQVVYLNGETIRNNVAFFDSEENIDDKKVVECLKYAQVWEDIVKMPEGIYTIIGENGISISGGQRQRIALARALYKEPEILVMDEATAALDVETEKAVIDSIRMVKKNKTLIIATHRISLANECDLIYKIENQKIVQVK